VTTYGYDANSNRNAVTDPQNHLTNITYDALDRVQSVTYSQSTGKGPRSYNYGYDPEGNITSVDETVLLDAPELITRRYTRSYDKRDRLTSATDPFKHTVKFDYDAANNLTSLTDAANNPIGYSYDALNRVQTVTLANQSATINYQWQADGLLKQVSYPSGMQRDYLYDAADRLTKVTNHINTTESEEFAYTYDANSNRATETRNQNGRLNRSISYDYDLLDRLTSANYTTVGQRPADPAPGQSASYNEGTRLNGFDYDKVGNRKKATVQDRTTTITLTTNSEGVTSESRQIADGTLVTTTGTFNDLNQLTQLSSDAAGSVATNYNYDRNGNLTSASQNNQVISSFEYDCRDQLRRVLNGSSQEIAAYDYNFDRQRTGKTVGGVPLTFVYAGDQVINEYGLNDQLVNRYDLSAGEVVRAQFAGEGERYYFSDGQGSITSLAQQTQSPPASLTARYEYDAWGQSLASSGASYNSIGYTGQRFDGETGLMPLGNGERYYSPFTGSFIQQDSFTGMAMMAQSMNRYAYAVNNPLRFRDRNGNNPEESWGDYFKNRLSESVELWNDFALGIGDSFEKAGKGIANAIENPGEAAVGMWTGTKQWAKEVKEIAFHPMLTGEVLGAYAMENPKAFMRGLGETGGDLIIAEAGGKVVSPIVKPLTAPLKAVATRALTETVSRIAETGVGRATAGAVREGLTRVGTTLRPLTQTVKQGVREAGERLNPFNYRVNPNKLGVGLGSLEKIGKQAAKDVLKDEARLVETGRKFGPEPGTPEPDWGAVVREFEGEPPADMMRPHGHHTVFKEGRGQSMQGYVNESKDILEHYEIDWYRGRENLGWAPNKNHSTAAAKAVRDALLDAHQKVGTREAIVDALSRMKEHFRNDTISTLYDK
jgi:RHS repeat-associated protein